MERADICLVNLGLAKSRTHAKRIITEKRAFYNGRASFISLQDCCAYDGSGICSKETGDF